MNYEQYHQKGGFYAIPVEIFDDLCEEKDELQKENQKIKYELEQCIAVADTNIELAEKYHKEIERLKSLLKCDYEDNQEIMADIIKEKQELIDYLKEQITLCNERIDFHKSEISGVTNISDDNRHLILIKKNKIRKESFEEILSKIEKE